MITVRDRAEQVLRRHVRTWTVGQLSKELEVTEETTRIALLGMHHSGLAARRWLMGRYVYWSTAHGDPGDVDT